MNQMTANILEYGAVADGQTLNTAAIQSAIDSLPDGGTVIVPPGVYLSGTIELKSNITLYLSAGAVLRGAPAMDAYREIGFYHNEMKETISFLYALSKENITICGEGTIDLNGHNFVDFDTLVPMGDVDLDTLTEKQREESVVMFKTRPNQPIFFHDCTRVRIKDITVLDAPCWTITFSDSKDVKITGISMRNHPRIPNDDGIHLSATQDVIISDCSLSCGDDCIAMTCITDWDGCTKNIIISDCVLSARSAAVRMGHLESKVENVQVHHCTITETNRGFAIFAADGGYVKNVIVSDCIIKTHMYAGGWWGKGEPAVICAANSSGQISAVSFRSVQAESENPFLVVGKDGNVEQVTISDLSIRVSKGENHALFPDFFELDPNGRVAKDESFSGWLYSSGVNELQLSGIRAEVV